MWRHDNHIELLLVSNLVRASCLQGYLLLTVDRLLRNACTIKLFSICGLTTRLYVPSATVCSTAPKRKTNLKITCPRYYVGSRGNSVRLPFYLPNCRCGWPTFWVSLRFAKVYLTILKMKQCIHLVCIKETTRTVDYGETDFRFLIPSNSYINWSLLPLAC